MRATRVRPDNALTACSCNAPTNCAPQLAPWCAPCTPACVAQANCRMRMSLCCLQQVVMLALLSERLLRQAEAAAATQRQPACTFEQLRQQHLCGCGVCSNPPTATRSCDVLSFRRQQPQLCGRSGCGGGRGWLGCSSGSCCGSSWRRRDGLGSGRGGGSSLCLALCPTRLHHLPHALIVLPPAAVTTAVAAVVLHAAASATTCIVLCGLLAGLKQPIVCGSQRFETPSAHAQHTAPYPMQGYATEHRQQ
jgi:hypothetical protein